jgi:hypothetical protein
MSLYRYKINNRSVFLTGGTINPMENPTTGNQKFNNYLPIKFLRGQENANLSNVNSKLFLNKTEDFSFNQYRISVINNNGLNPKETPDISQYASSGKTINPDTNYKNLVLPIEVSFNVVDYGDDIQRFVKNEETKAVNKIIDGEKVKYINEGYPNTVKINFRFYDKSTGQFDDNNLNGGYNLAGFTNDEINKKNNFKKSYFRLYFFDSNDTKTQNLLTTEDIDVFNSQKPSFTFNRIYWLKNDELFLDTLDDRLIFMEARFFNAKTGRVHRFINPPSTTTTPMSISTFSNNLEWKSSQLLILNPKNNNNNRYFRILPGIGSNTTSEITLTEYILQT